MLHCDCSKPNIWIGYSCTSNQRFLRCLNCQWQSRFLSAEELDNLVVETLAQREQRKSEMALPPPIAEMGIWEGDVGAIEHYEPKGKVIEHGVVVVPSPSYDLCPNCGLSVEGRAAGQSVYCKVCREMYSVPRRSVYWLQVQENWEAEQQHKRRIVRGDA